MIHIIIPRDPGRSKIILRELRPADVLPSGGSIVSIVKRKMGKTYMVRKLLESINKEKELKFISL